MTREKYDAYDADLASVEAEAKRELALADFKYIRPEVDFLLQEEGISIAPSSPAYTRLCYAVQKASVRSLSLLRMRHQGEPVDTPPEPSKPTETASLRLSEVYGRWKLERKPPTRTLMEWNTAVERFKALHGDKPIATITKADIVDLKDNLLQQGKAAATVVKQVGALRATLQYAVDNGLLGTNPASGVKVAGGKKGDTARLPYDANDLKAIFTSPVFVLGERPRAGAGEAAFWLPLLGLFTGARLNELGQALVTDVRELDGVVYLDLNTEGEGKSLKNQGSRRKVPLHPELVRIGFLDYVQKQRQRCGGDGRLFDKLEPNSNGVLTANFSKWWGRYARDNGIPKGPKVFHSFRHSFKDACRECGIPKDVHDALTGHAPGDVGGRYGQGFTVKRLAEEMVKVVYPGLDLVGLAWKQ